MANTKFHFDKMIDVPSEYVTLTDNVMYQIEHTKDAVMIYWNCLMFQGTYKSVKVDKKD